MFVQSREEPTSPNDAKQISADRKFNRLGLLLLQKDVIRPLKTKVLQPLKHELLRSLKKKEKKSDKRV